MIKMSQIRVQLNFNTWKKRKQDFAISEINNTVPIQNNSNQNNQNENYEIELDDQ